MARGQSRPLLLRRVDVSQRPAEAEDRSVPAELVDGFVGHGQLPLELRTPLVRVGEYAGETLSGVGRL